nr:hypothetical protein [Candidatus Sigynarchaeota archaeon]
MEEHMLEKIIFTSFYSMGLVALVALISLLALIFTNLLVINMWLVWLFAVAIFTLLFVMISAVSVLDKKRTIRLKSKLCSDCKPLFEKYESGDF